MDDTMDMPAPPRANRQAVEAALAQLPRGTYIAADADNTLWAGDVGDEVVKVAGETPYLPWQPGQIDVAKYFAMMEHAYIEGCCYSAETLSQVPWHAAQPRLESALKQRVFPRQWLISALQQAMTRGVQLVVISASPQPIVEMGVELFGLTGCKVIAVKHVRAPEPHFFQPLPIGFGKVHAWQAAGLPQPAVALGDSRWDLPLLAHAVEGFWLTPADQERLKT